MHNKTQNKKMISMILTVLLMTSMSMQVLAADSIAEECTHTYEKSVTAPTCQTMGYTTSTCTECGESTQDCYTAAADHDYQWTPTDGSTHRNVCVYCGRANDTADCSTITWTAGGQNYQVCKVCGDFGTGRFAAVDADVRFEDEEAAETAVSVHALKDPCGNSLMILNGYSEDYRYIDYAFTVAAVEDGEAADWELSAELTVPFSTRGIKKYTVLHLTDDGAWEEIDFETKENGTKLTAEDDGLYLIVHQKLYG